MFIHTQDLEKWKINCAIYIIGGVIGNVANIETDLSADNLQEYCFTDKMFDIKGAIRRSLSLIDVADYSVTMPILALTYLAPLKSILTSVNIFADFILFLQGQSGARKSSLTAVALSHFGNFNRDNFPCSFRDTINSIEKKSFILKDTLNVIDDFNPEVISSKNLYTVDKLFGMYGDRSGRTRMSQDGKTLKSAYTARGLAIITGEMIPDVAQSRIARSLIITIKNNSIDLKKLAVLQHNTEELSYCMKNFITWIIANEEEIKEYVKTNFAQNQENIKTSNEIHGRTREIANILPIGFSLFTLFAQTHGAITDIEKAKLDNKLLEVLCSQITNQTSEVQDLKPTELFYSALEEMLQNNTIQLIEISKWRPIGSGVNVGYYDAKKDVLYLFPNTIYNEVLKFYNNKFPVPQNTLWRYMAEEGLLYQNDKKRFKVTRKIFKDSVSVIEIKAHTLISIRKTETYSNSTEAMSKIIRGHDGF